MQATSAPAPAIARVALGTAFQRAIIRAIASTSLDLHVEHGLHGLRDPLRGGSGNRECHVGARALVDRIAQRPGPAGEIVFGSIRSVQRRGDGIERVRERGAVAAIAPPATRGRPERSAGRS